MFICNNCGETFEECEVYREHHPYGMGTATEEFNICPNCKDTDISEAKQCTRCGEYVAELNIGLCEVCHEDVWG